MNYSQGNTLNQTVRDSNYFLPKPGDYKAFSLKTKLQFKRCELLKAKRKIDWKDRWLYKNKRIARIKI